MKIEELHLPEIKPLTVTEFARMGGNATKKKFNSDYFRELQKKAAKKRKKNNKEKDHSSK